MKKIIAFCLLFGSILPVFSQKMLLLEKYGRAKTTRIYPGQSLKFKLKDQPGWYTRELTDVLPDQKSIVLDLEIVKIEDIDKLRVRRKFPMKALGSSLLTFSASLALFSTVAYLRDGSVEPGWLSIGAGSTLIGLVLIRDKGKKLRLGEKHKLRALDLPVMK